MDKKEAFDFLCRLAEGIAVMFGSSCETLIHDMSVPNHPILAIYNGHVTGREVGSTVDIFGSKVDTDNTVYHGKDYVNHLVVTASGKHIKTSTFNFFGKGYKFALGINFDFTLLMATNHHLVDFMSVGTELQSAISQVREGHLNDIFDECANSMGKPLDSLNKTERLKLITMLHQNNAFSFQKSVPFVAEKLNISRYTVYKDIKEIEENHTL